MHIGEIGDCPRILFLQNPSVKALFSQMKRDLNKLVETAYDLLIIGGGINGACAAWDAACVAFLWLSLIREISAQPLLLTA